MADVRALASGRGDVPAAELSEARAAGVTSRAAEGGEGSSDNDLGDDCLGELLGGGLGATEACSSLWANSSAKRAWTRSADLLSAGPPLAGVAERR